MKLQHCVVSPHKQGQLTKGLREHMWQGGLQICTGIVLVISETLAMAIENVLSDYKWAIGLWVGLANISAGMISVLSIKCHEAMKDRAAREMYLLHPELQRPSPPDPALKYRPSLDLDISVSMSEEMNIHPEKQPQQELQWIHKNSRMLWLSVAAFNVIVALICALGVVGSGIMMNITMRRYELVRHAKNAWAIIFAKETLDVILCFIMVVLAVTVIAQSLRTYKLAEPNCVIARQKEVAKSASEDATVSTLNFKNIRSTTTSTHQHIHI